MRTNYGSRQQAVATPSAMTSQYSLHELWETAQTVSIASPELGLTSNLRICAKADAPLWLP